MYSCELCGFNSPSKSNYEKHRETQKHKKNVEKENERLKKCNECNTSTPIVEKDVIYEKQNTLPVSNEKKQNTGTIIDNDIDLKNLSISNEPTMSEDVIQELLKKTEITQLSPERQSYLKKLISHVCKTKNIVTTNNPTTTTNNTTVNTKSNNEFTLNIFMNNQCKIRIDITELALTIIGEETNIMENVPEYLNRIIKVLIPIIIQMIRDKEFPI